jgi:4-hydroxyphenylpyruvate dioxygenase
MDIRLDGRVVLLSGAAQGIGRAMAQAFRGAGARIHLTDLDPVGLAAAGDSLSAPVHVCDLSDRESAHRLVTDVVAREGRLDILALAAGGARGQVGRPLEEITARDWRVLFEANVEAALWLSQAAAPHFKAAGWGRIVAIASAEMRARGADFLKIPDNYYDDIEAKYDLDAATMVALRDNQILYDREGDGEFFQIYTHTFDERFFFEIVQRRNYQGFGAVNAAVRLAAQTRESRPLTIPRA